MKNVEKLYWNAFEEFRSKWWVATGVRLEQSENATCWCIPTPKKKEPREKPRTEKMMKKVSTFNDILNEIWYYLFVFFPSADLLRKPSARNFFVFRENRRLLTEPRKVHDRTGRIVGWMEMEKVWVLFKMSCFRKSKWDEYASIALVEWQWKQGKNYFSVLYAPKSPLN